MRRHQRCVLLIVGTLLSGLSAAHAASYTFTTIDVPGALHTNAAGINDRGQIVGTWVDAVRGYGFLLDHGTFTTIDLPDSSTVNVFGINKDGEIVGMAAGATGSRGFLFSHGTFTPVNVPDSRQTQATGINSHDQIVGFYQDASGNPFGFLLAMACENPIGEKSPGLDPLPDADVIDRDLAVAPVYD